MQNDESSTVSRRTVTASSSILHSTFCILHSASSLLRLLMVRRLAAEEQGADPYQGRALGDGQLEIVAHSHAQVAEGGAADLVPAHFFEDLAGAGERDAHL